VKNNINEIVVVKVIAGPRSAAISPPPNPPPSWGRERVGRIIFESFTIV
jgi:hypothetical protein